MVSSFYNWSSTGILVHLWASYLGGHLLASRWSSIGFKGGHLFGGHLIDILQKSSKSSHHFPVWLEQDRGNLRWQNSNHIKSSLSPYIVIMLKIQYIHKLTTDKKYHHYQI